MRRAMYIPGDQTGISVPHLEQTLAALRSQLSLAERCKPSLGPAQALPGYEGQGWGAEEDFRMASLFCFLPCRNQSTKVKGKRVPFALKSDCKG